MPVPEVAPVGAEYAAELFRHGSFGVTVGADVVRLDELTALELGAVQRETGLAWTDLVSSPSADLLGALALVEVCEAHAEASTRTAVSALTVAEVLERIVRVAPVLEAVPVEVD